MNFVKECDLQERQLIIRPDGQVGVIKAVDTTSVSVVFDTYHNVLNRIPRSEIVGKYTVWEG